jgi:hypothetical protein
MEMLQQLEEAEQDGNIRGLNENYSRSQNEQIEQAAPSGRILFGEAKQANVSNGRTKAAGDITAGDADHVSIESSDEELEVESTEKAYNGARQNSSESSFSGRMVLSKLDCSVEGGRALPGSDQLRVGSNTANDFAQNGMVSFLGLKTLSVKRVEVPKAGLEAKPSLNGGFPAIPSLSRKTGASSTGVLTDASVPQSTFSDNSDDEQQLDVLDANGSQQGLIRQAFAGDDVEAEFEKTKSQVLDEEVPAGEGPVQLPGWGQWTHVQKIKGQPAWLVKEQEQLKIKREQALNRRKDSHRKHVIISERVDKKVRRISSFAMLPCSWQHLLEAYQILSLWFLMFVSCWHVFLLAE